MMNYTGGVENDAELNFISGSSFVWNVERNVVFVLGV